MILFHTSVLVSSNPPPANTKLWEVHVLALSANKLNRRIAFMMTTFYIIGWFRLGKGIKHSLFDLWLC